jgi:hypothetical protein
MNIFGRRDINIDIKINVTGTILKWICIISK